MNFDKVAVTTTFTIDLAIIPNKLKRMIRIFRNIDECVTMKSAAFKKGRNIQEQDLSIVNNAAVIVDGKSIAWVGDSKKIPRSYAKKKTKEISLKGKTVLPGFVECHTHMVFAGDRAPEFEMKFQGKNYQEIAQSGGGIVKTVQATRDISDKDLLKISQKRADNFVNQGVTTVEIKSGYGLNLQTEIKILKTAAKLHNIRSIPTYLGPHAIPKEHTVNDYFAQVLQDLQKISAYTKRADIFIEKGYFSVEQAKKYFEVAKNLGMKIVAHTNQLNLSEGLDQAVILGATSCDHLNFLDESQIRKISQSETTCVLIPTADFYLNVRYPRARELLDQGARVALSTDYNPGTSPTQDIQWVGLLARKEMKMKLHEVLAAWTVAPAHALSIQNVVGSLEENKSADFSIMNCSWKDLFYQVGFNEIDEVFLEGKKVR